MVHRLRESWKSFAGVEKIDGPVEIDEVYLGGLEKNKHKRFDSQLANSPHAAA